MPSPPTPAPPSCDVIIITVKNFFSVPRQTLMSYDLSLFNLFVDDIHGYQPYEYENVSTYTAIGDFVNSAYITSSWNNHHCWFGVDEVQQGWYDSNCEMRLNTAGILYKRGGERKLDIPVVIMDQILRNTKDIVNVMEEARKEQASTCRLETSMLIPNIGCGHHIAGQRVVYHKLMMIGPEERVRSEFICERVEELFHTLSSTSSSPSPQFDFSTVAILFESDYFLSPHKSPIEQMLLTKFALGTQTIEQQLLTNNHTNVVMDTCDNIQSYEAAVVVYVRTFGNEYGYHDYNAISRARTLCMIVDIDIDDDRPSLQNVDLIEWEASNGVFTTPISPLNRRRIVDYIDLMNEW